MELTTLTKLTFLGGALAISAAAVLLALVFQRAEEWLRSRRKRVLTRPLPGAAGQRPESGRANEKALRISQARWRMLL